MCRFIKQLKVELPSDPAIPLLGIHLKKPNTNLRRYRQFIAVLFIIANIQKQPKCLQIDEWIRCGTYIKWNLIHP